MVGFFMVLKLKQSKGSGNMMGESSGVEEEKRRWEKSLRTMMVAHSFHVRKAVLHPQTSIGTDKMKANDPSGTLISVLQILLSVYHWDILNLL